MMTDESLMADESFKSPELRLEHEVKLMETEMDAAFELFQIDSAEDERDIDQSEVETMSTANNEYNEYNEANNEHMDQTPLPPILPLVQEAPTATAAPSMNGHNETIARYHYADILKTLAALLASIPRGLCLALVIFVFSMIAQMYPTAPQSGCYIALLLALFHIKPVSSQDKGGKLHLESRSWQVLALQSYLMWIG